MDTNTDYKKILTQVIQKQMVILGPAITLAKARNVKGLTISDDGAVTEMAGTPQELIQNLIDQFVQLSGLIVRKTMEPLLASLPDGIAINPVVAASGVQPTPQPAEQSIPQQTPPTQPPIQEAPTQNTDLNPNG